MTGLKPCPFCGHMPVIMEGTDATYSFWIYIQCECCGLLMHGTSRHQLVKKWNRRMSE